MFGPALAARIATFFVAEPIGPSEVFPALTDREREALDLVAAGRSNGQIAAALYLSPKAMRNNVSKVVTKLQAAGARDAGMGRLR